MKHHLSNAKKQTILIFSPMKKLVGMFYSLTAAARSLGTSPSNVEYACNGRSISCCGVYARQIPDDIEIEPEDYGTLRLEDFDKMCGVERKYYPTRKMSRVGMRYKKES